MFDWYTGSFLQIAILVGCFAMAAFIAWRIVAGGSKKTPLEQAQDDVEEMLYLQQKQQRRHVRAGSAWLGD